MAIPPVSKLMATFGWDGVDPGFCYQFLEEDGGTAKIEDYVEGGLGRRTTPRPTRTPITRPSTRETTLPYLRIPGTFEYWDILDKNLSAAMSGAKTRSRRSTTRRRPGSRSPTASAATSSSSRLSGGHRLRAVDREAHYRPGRFAAPASSLSEHPMRWTSRVRFLFLIPAVIWVLAFTIFPLGYSLYLAFYKIEQKVEVTRVKEPMLDAQGQAGARFARAAAHQERRPEATR